MAVIEGGPMFLNTVNVEGKTKNMKYIRVFFLKAIEEVGPENVAQVITDNAPVCKAFTYFLDSLCGSTHSCSKKYLRGKKY